MKLASNSIAPRFNLRKSGFTLIELLVVIAIIAILASILFPVFGRARENARRTSCLSNVKQMGLGIMQYMQDFDEIYPVHYNGTQRWPQMVNPYVKSNQLYDCPSRSTTYNYDGTYRSAGRIAYGINYWLNSYFPTTGSPPVPTSPIKMSAIQRPTETVWIAEIIGVTPADVAIDVDANSYQCYPSYFGGNASRNSGTYGFDVVPEPRGRLSKRHFDGTNVLWADGHAKWIRRDVLEGDYVSGNETTNRNASKYWWGR